MSEAARQERYEKSPACYQFYAELEAHLEGEPRPGVTAHVKDCSWCRLVLADLELIRSASRQLPLDEPPRKVWTELRAALTREGIIREETGGWPRWFESFGVLSSPTPLAAVACLVILAAVVVVPPAGLDRREPSPALAVSDRSMVVLSAVDLEESRLVGALHEVEASYKARETSLEPAIKATYAKSLESLDASIQECRASINREPSNTLAREYLLSAYAHKAEVLATALEYDTR